jgi:SAM-dependent methyltransferase
MSSAAAVATTLNSDCPVCGDRDVEAFCEAGARRFKRCGACGTVFQFPPPTLQQTTARHTGHYRVSYFAKSDKKLRKARFEMSLFRWLLPRRGRFLDIGCNGGFMVAAAVEAGLDAHGVDVDADSIGYAREHYPAGVFYLGSPEKLPPDIGQFDFIHCSEVLEHVPQAQDFVFAIARLLKPRGFLYITTPNIYHWTVRDRRAFKSMRSDGHVIFYRPSGLRRLLRTVGIDFQFSVPNAKPGMRMLFRKQR